MNNRTSLHEQLYCIHPQHTHSPCTSTCTTHPAIPSQLPSTTLLCTQLTNTKHSWQNGTRCRDGVNVLWCRSHLVWLVFEGSIPTCAGFHSENFFVTCSILQQQCNVLASNPRHSLKKSDFSCKRLRHYVMLKCILVSNSFNTQYNVCFFLFTSQASSTLLISVSRR